MADPTLLVALKWVDRRPTVDPLTGAVATDSRTSGTSPADDAALEWALRLAERWSATVVAATAGPPGADVVLRDALAAGAHRAVRVDGPVDAPSVHVAAGLVAVATGVGATMVLCGDMSLDRGSGSVPAFAAAGLGAAQALGLVAVRPGRPGELEGWRRLDGGRRERLAVTAPFVVSVEGGTARRRRASLLGMQTAAGAVVEVWSAPTDPTGGPGPAVRGPYRPRPRRVAGPDPNDDVRHRTLALLGPVTTLTAASTVSLDPEDAAVAILEALTAWGQFP